MQIMFNTRLSYAKINLGLNPQIDGQLVRLLIPDLSERRVEIKR